MSESPKRVIKEIAIEGQRLWLLPEKAVFLPEHNALLVSDLHLGKSMHFRKNGIALPAGDSEKTLSELNNLIELLDCSRLYFLGDLFHSEMNSEWKLLVDFIKKFSDIEFTLIRGNHDLFEDRFYVDSGLKVEEYCIIGNAIKLLHKPPGTSSTHFVLCGHLHPAVVLTGKGKQRIKLPCFVFNKKTGILPAFGQFTGLQVVKRTESKRIFVTSNNEVIEVISK